MSMLMSHILHALHLFVLSFVLVCANCAYIASKNQAL